MFVSFAPKKLLFNRKTNTMKKLLTLVVLLTAMTAAFAQPNHYITFNGTDDAVNRFLEWVLENGIKYNHQYGLLNLDSKFAEAQTKKVINTLTAQK